MMASPSAEPVRRAAPGSGRRRWRALCAEARGLLEQVSREMEAYADERSEAWEESEHGESFRETLEAVTELAEALADIPSLEPSPKG